MNHGDKGSFVCRGGDGDSYGPRTRCSFFCKTDLDEQRLPKPPRIICHELEDGTVMWADTKDGKRTPITVDQIEAEAEKTNCPALDATCRDFPLEVNNGYFNCLVDGKSVTQDFPKNTKCTFQCNSSNSHPKESYTLECTGVLDLDGVNLSWMAQYGGRRTQFIHISVIPIDTKGLCEVPPA